MSISRTGQCPIFLDYVTQQALIPRAGTLSSDFIQLTQYNFRWIDIPCYQRGLVWEEEDFEQLLNSRSIFMGNAIFGSFELPTPRGSFDRVPDTATHYEVLVDGLQRFSIGTALLHILHLFVLSNHPRYPNEVQHYAALGMKAGSWAPVYEHNDHELTHHHRKAVRASYVEFKGILANWIENEFNQGRGQALAARIQHLFLQRQIAPDSYYGFRSEYDVTSTFIGLNTIRVQLSIVDWLRSVIVDRGATSGWAANALGDIDNRFTEVFIRGTNPVPELMPFASIILDCLTKPTAAAPKHAACVFPSWMTGLDEGEVRRFLDYVEVMRDFKGNPFFQEISKCGKMPFAGVLCYYYRLFLLNGNQYPSFINHGGHEDAELHAFLRANYRSLLAGCIGRTRDYAERLLREAISLTDMADEVSSFGLSCVLSSPVDPNWLRTVLAGSDKARAQRVFNACLLPTSSTPGGSFKPHIYGTKGKSYQIDHMIPESIIQENQPGEAEAYSLPNFAPVRRSANNAQSNLSCSGKFATGGSYANECALDPQVHPYVQWLVGNQSKYGAFLDDQNKLQPNSTPPIVEERLAWLVNCLVNRL